MARGSKPTYRRGEHYVAFLLGKIMLACAFFGIAGLGAYLVSTTLNDPDGQNLHNIIAGNEASNRVSFVAVGDNLPDNILGVYADSCAGEIGDGEYDYRPIFSAIKPYIKSADLAYLNFETHAGGDSIGPRGWPSFNTTDTMVDAVCDTGFNLIASATNHSYDWGQDALEHSVALWKEKPVHYTGTARTPEEASTIKPYAKNGINFTLLNYTYALNGYDEDEVPAHAVNYLHEDRLEADIAKARAVSDIVIVAMHWGTENQVEPDEEQLRYAQLAADAGADLILGSHTHVIGPLVWLEGATGNKTLVAYSLGNFLSHHDTPDALNELEGMLRCDFVKTDKGTAIENVRWTPLINHREEGNYRVFALKDYTYELAGRHPILASLDDPLEWMKEKSAEVIGSDFTLDV